MDAYLYVKGYLYLCPVCEIKYILNIQVIIFSWTYMSHVIYNVYINMFIFFLSFIANLFYRQFYFYLLMLLAPNAFIINNFIYWAFFMFALFIFLPPLPNALFYKIFVIMGYGGICLYIYICIFVMIYKFSKEKMCV